MFENCLFWHLSISVRKKLLCSRCYMSTHKFACFLCSCSRGKHNYNFLEGGPARTGELGRAVRGYCIHSGARAVLTRS